MSKSIHNHEIQSRYVQVKYIKKINSALQKLNYKISPHNHTKIADQVVNLRIFNRERGSKAHFRGWLRVEKFFGLVIEKGRSALREQRM